VTVDATGERRRAFIAWSFVAGQFALIALMVFAPRDDGFAVPTALGVVGLALLAAGVVLGLWSAVHLGNGLTPSPLPNGAVSLVVSGPYRWMRHPIYVAVMLFMGGVSIRSGSLRVVAAFVALVVLFNVKARWEEARLVETFEGYRAYAGSTPRFLPLWPMPQS
jgi:protein-S-isoprenylcysteine O-methyltransferase Ste14